MSKIAYRPDIDGLRAVAVLSVMIYHAGFAFLPGGFMGVDIFFVISGYLITSLIVADLQAGQFRLRDFWERRARRILPPLFLVCLACLICGFFLLLPFDYMLFGKQLVSQSFFSSNLLFVQEGGYFSTDNDVKPLLHTWSLAVEEQFYLFFPLCMLLVHRFLKGRYAILLALAGLACLISSLIIIELSQRMAFYLLPFRGWELIAGALLVFAPPVQKNIAEWMGVAGLTLLAYALFFYSPADPFPGWNAIPPVAGAALLIWAGKSGSFVSRLLSLRVMVGVGLISYSLYLWHWPIIVFAKYQTVIEFTPWMGVLCFVLTFPLAALTWKYVEQPVRKKKIFPGKKSIFLFSLCGLIGMAAAGGALIAMKGVPDRLDPAVARYSMGAENSNPHRAVCDQPDTAKILSGELCQTNAQAGAPSFLLWGDSHADAIAPVFFHLSEKQGVNGYVATAHGCPPVEGVEILHSYRAFRCLDFNAAILKLVEEKKIKKVFMVTSWDSWFNSGSLYFPDDGWYEKDKNRFDRIVPAGLERTLLRLQAMGVHVYMLQDVPVADFDPPRALALNAMYHAGKDIFIPRKAHEESLKKNILAFKERSLAKNVSYLNPDPHLCGAEKCRVEYAGESFYFNPGHLSVAGALWLEPLFAPYLRP